MNPRRLAALVLSVMTFAVTMTVAPPASAAPVPQCDNYLNHFDATYKWSVPVYRDSAGNGTDKCLMGDAYDSQGIEVTVLQRTLHDCYGQNIAVDGDFGPDTAAALANAQRFHHISADGVYGPQTATALAWNSTPNGRFFPQC